MIVNPPPFVMSKSDHVAGQYSASGFEGPEKLLEIWFYPNKDTEETGLRSVDRKDWEEMLDLVNCKVLSVISNESMDAYLLSESSMFIHSHRLILKTCGTTTLLHAIPRILEIAHTKCNLTYVDSLFYSRKSFMFPEKQRWPHGSWRDEVTYLDHVFDPEKFHTSAYVVGKINSDHWNLFIATPRYSKEDEDAEDWETVDETAEDEAMAALYRDDVCLEIMMTELDQNRMKMFYKQSDDDTPERVFQETGMKDLFPKSNVDHFLFDPCGYSLNGLQGPYYWTVHVTPEAHCSYASLETNIPIGEGDYSTYEEVIRKVVDVFKPGKFTCTLFTRKPPGQEREDSDSESTSSGAHSLAASTLMTSETPSPRPPATPDDFDKKRLAASLFSDGVIAREHSRMLLGNKNVAPGFTRRDRIVYDLGRWDLVFSQFSERFRVKNAKLLRDDVDVIQVKV